MYKTWECGLISYHALSPGQENNLPTHLPSHPLFPLDCHKPSFCCCRSTQLWVSIGKVNFFPCHFVLGAFGGLLWSLASSGSYSGGLVCSFAWLSLFAEWKHTVLFFRGETWAVWSAVTQELCLFLRSLGDCQATDSPGSRYSYVGLENSYVPWQFRAELYAHPNTWRYENQ